MIRIQKWNQLRTKCFNIRLITTWFRFGIQFNREYSGTVKGTYLGVHLVIETPFRFINIGNDVLGTIRMFIPSIYTLNEMLKQRLYYKQVYLRMKRNL